MNIENIEAFIYVLHYGSFNKAAEALYLSQPSVTARIQTLERELDCTLFDRVGKQVHLTEKGKLFRPYAQQLIDTYRKSKQQLRETLTSKEELRIGCTASVAHYMLPELLPGLRSRFPMLRFKIVTGTTDDIVARVLGKELDIGFVRKISHPDLQSTVVYEDPIRLYVYGGHPFWDAERPPIEALGQEPLLFFECGALDWMRIHRVFEHLGLLPNLILQTDNLETAKKLVLQQTGICFLPGLSVRRELALGLVKPIDFPETSGIALKTCLIGRQGENAAYFQDILRIAYDRFSRSRSGIE
ncbi:LysR family transcriptional regulator [Cohnella nanjingensis]|uniref:LysR family transcriptional regulator n=1 Tax=Cohnella nanjingensis TaxID=1387779 RepID=A0A7X0RWY2_9BACL|nr:LysR family transcriptional regulator [Cohnella nanjingensis]MBB6675148.1 LysR family transcriptional regulator [Cohnella nanjingensis]